MCLTAEALVEANQAADVDSIAVKLAENLIRLQEKELAYMVKGADSMVSWCSLYILLLHLEGWNLAYK